MKNIFKNFKQQMYEDAKKILDTSELLSGDREPSFKNNFLSKLFPDISVERFEKYVNEGEINSDISYYNMNGKLILGEKKSSNIKKIVLTDLKLNTEEIKQLIEEGRVMNVPSQDLMNKVEDLYKIALKGYYEEAYVVATDGTISSKKIGKKPESFLHKKEVELIELYNELIRGGKIPSFCIHTHPTARNENGDLDPTKTGTAYPSGTIGTTNIQDADFGFLHFVKTQNYSHEPSWVLGFQLNIIDGNPPEYIKRINFFYSDWVYVKLDTIKLNPTSNQGIDFIAFKKTVKKLNK